MNRIGIRRASFSPEELSGLEGLARLFPDVATASIEIASLEALLQLPRGTVHVMSDVHGDFKKLQHVLNNASGSIRPLVDEVFAGRLTAEDKERLLGMIYYPAQMFDHLHMADADMQSRSRFVLQILRQQFTVVAALARRYTLRQLEQAFPSTYHELFRELLWEAQGGRPLGYLDAMLRGLCEQGKGLEAVQWASWAIRQLSVFEVIVAGDMGDRGERLDKVMELLMRQPRVAITWGNHDASWMGAALGHEALIATVLRASLRYGRLSQLEEGFGISLQPLEKLARDVYWDDPASHFQVRGDSTDLRDVSQMQKMQKAIAVIQFKLEAQLIARRPEYRMQHRALIEHLDLGKGTVLLDGRAYPLTDSVLPTLDPRQPAALSPEEKSCILRLRKSFLDSEVLAQQMAYLARRGSSYLVRDEHLIFHGCVPVDDSGAFLPMELDGSACAGRALFDAIDGVVHRAFRERRAEDLDVLWYLWAGPASPMFGKHKMATFETYFVADKGVHREMKNPYYRLINSSAFCQSVLAEFGVDPQGGMIVNGHVRVMEGEQPLKESGQAMAIDGGFCESYGDRGYTLILDSAGTQLAEHHHFESIASALTQGADICPRIRTIRRYGMPRRVADTEAGTLIRNRIAALKRLIIAYGENALREQPLQVGNSQMGTV
jgi:fructose-1,6-bisphosphatase-3